MALDNITFMANVVSINTAVIRRRRFETTEKETETNNV